MRNTEVDTGLWFVAVEQLTKIDWCARKNQVCFQCNYVKGKTEAFPAESPLVRCNASGTKVRKDDHTEVKQRYCNKFANVKTSMELVRLVWHCFFADGAYIKATFIVEKQNALIKEASPTVSTKAADTVVLKAWSSSNPAMPRNEQCCTTGD